MDERKKTIKELEERKRHETESVIRLEESLGDTLLERLHRDGESTQWGNFVEYRRLLLEIADAEAYIKRIETDAQRLKEVEAAIGENEKLLAEQSKELVERHITLGGQILAEPDLSGYSQTYQTQLEAIQSKIQELETKLGGLEDKDGEKSGILSRIGKNVQGLALRSTLGKNQEQVRKLCEAAGEKFTLADNATGNEGLSAFAAEVEELRCQRSVLADELTALKAERSSINETFAKEGNPSRHIQSLEKYITQTNDGIHALYAKAGKEAADAAFAGKLDALDTSLSDDETALLDKIALTREIARDTATRIASLNAAIAIDETEGQIDRHRKAIEEQRRRVAAGEAAIAGLETRIAELRKLL
jgi:phage shock protein A